MARTLDAEISAPLDIPADRSDHGEHGAKTGD
jgi:hypothetical protein